MPTYDYLCDDCQNQFEEFQRITAAPLEKCPKCGGHVRRLISPGNGLIFKGSGFYITDYKKTNVQKSEKKNESKETKPASGKTSDAS